MSKTPDKRSTAPGTDQPARMRVIGADGARWIVREVPAPAFDRRGGTHLIFTSDDVMRRVRDFPAGWYDLSDDALYALCQDLRSDE